MIILDTNVVSEPLKPAPSPTVIRWLDAQDPQTLCLTSVSLAELLSGVEILPGGRRRSALKRSLGMKIEALFRGRVLAFDQDAAEAFAAAYAGAKAVGNRISFADCAIAAVATAGGHLLATRNVANFKGTRVEIVNPWEA